MAKCQGCKKKFKERKMSFKPPDLCDDCAELPSIKESKSHQEWFEDNEITGQAQARK